MSTLAINPVTGNYVLTEDGPRYGQTTITPEQAETILDQRNTRNRNISPSIVAKYARDMTSGSWVQNGDPIRFAADGTLLDGQHRLAAIVKSGLAHRVFIVWNLPAEAQTTMDDGHKRTMADVLELQGRPQHSKTVASIARRAILWDAGIVSGGGSASPTKAEMLAYIDAHPLIEDAASIAEHMRASRGVRCAASTLGLAYLIFAGKSRTQADEFFDLLRTGAGLPEKHPILVLRDRLAIDGSTRVRTESPEVLAWFVKAWNAYRSGKSITILRQKAGENFPEPK